MGEGRLNWGDDQGTMWGSFPITLEGHDWILLSHWPIFWSFLWTTIKLSYLISLEIWLPLDSKPCAAPPYPQDWLHPSFNTSRLVEVSSVIWILEILARAIANQSICFPLLVLPHNCLIIIVSGQHAGVVASSHAQHNFHRQECITRFSTLLGVCRPPKWSTRQPPLAQMATLSSGHSLCDIIKINVDGFIVIDGNTSSCFGSNTD